jgi:alkylation response protein AidB-like acyl-CoA dehydrogenase
MIPTEIRPERKTTNGRTAAPDETVILERTRAIAADFAEQRRERQRRRELVPTDFARLAEAGFLLSGVPADKGGLWKSVARSTRPICELLRTLAHGDSSVALVCSMHPSVLGFWLATPRAPAPFRAAWDEQRRRIFQTARDGSWWGTASSEPGSGGDLSRTKAVAERVANRVDYSLTGHKQFASGSGVTSFMMTVAIPKGEEQPDLFYLDVQGEPWDGSTGLELIAPWDGHGMIATQSHAFRFERFPVTRAAWPGSFVALSAAAQPYIRCCFTAVCIGIVEAALATAREQLGKRLAPSRGYEQVEWARVELESWLAQQAYEGMLRAIEAERPDAGHATLQGKVAVAELAESALTRLCRVMGGGTYARSSPFGLWAQDVRALGFLRPTWGLAFYDLLEGSWAAQR